MAIVDDFNPSVATPSAGRRFPLHFGAACRAFFRALGAGWRAAADYRQLSEMSERQLRLRGLCRGDVPQEIHSRHFASLRGWLDSIDWVAVDGAQGLGAAALSISDPLR